MAGNASNADDDELPNLDDGEAENESTVAMEAPSFDRAGIPLPVSKPPPKAVEPPAPGVAGAATPAPAAGAPAKAPVAASRPAFAAAPPKAAGAAAPKPGKQTVIGLAPPAARPAGLSPGPRVPVAVPKPSTASAPATGPDAPKPAAEEPRELAPSKSTGRSAFAATYPSQYSFGSGPSAGAPAKDERPEQNDAATVSVPKDVLDRVRANPKAVLAESEKNIPNVVGDDDEDYEETRLAAAAGTTPPVRPDPAVPAAHAEEKKLHADDEEDYEETKAVPREDLLRPQDAHVVVGSDAKGEDATLAVPPSANEAALLNNIGAAIGESLQHPAMGYPPPPGGHPHPAGQMGPMAPMGGGTMGMPHPPAWSSHHMPVAPRVVGGSPSYGGVPMMATHGGIPRGPGPTNWSPLQNPTARRRISGQMILLLVVGFVCLAIFVTGIVLFATTKF